MIFSKPTVELVLYTDMTSQQLTVPAGKYVVAVSGGVDSVVLLDMLSRLHGLELIVAHFDHGIRPESTEDEQFVRVLANKNGLQYESSRVELGPNASEAEAREARYEFLRNIALRYGARGIITAHHQDDVIETSMINIIRGTGRHGLTSLSNNRDLVRPLLHIPKLELYKYAEQHGLSWREDLTNKDTKYLRNKLRIDVVAGMTDQQRADWLKLIEKAHVSNEKLDIEIGNLLRRGLHKNQLILNRSWFIKLPHSVSKEVLRVLLLRAGCTDIDRKTIERLTVQIKTMPQGKTLQAAGVDVLLTKRSARFQSRVGKTH